MCSDIIHLLKYNKTRLVSTHYDFLLTILVVIVYDQYIYILNGLGILHNFIVMFSPPAVLYLLLFLKLAQLHS